jgi:CDP-glucose 4,6-dehydratase
VEAVAVTPSHAAALPAPLTGGRLPDPAVWAGRRVLLTGHSGFKGGWALAWLSRLGAEVTGLSLPPETTPNLFDAAGLGARAHASHWVDLRDAAATRAAVEAAAPEIVLHMAAQPLVRRSYRDPVETFATNIMGTVHLLEALRLSPTPPRLVLVVTSDKVYANDETGRAFTEADRLGGHDPYAASKAATEIVVASYRDAFFAPLGARLATVRGGNVIGGGDFSDDRIVPDIVRAAQAGTALALRSPTAVRPWQHVLDCLSGYFAYAETLLADPSAPLALNIGPDASRPITVAEVAATLQSALGVATPWRHDAADAMREMTHLAIDASRARAALGWADRLPGTAALAWTAAWYAAFARGADAAALVEAELDRYTCPQDA